MLESMILVIFPFCMVFSAVSDILSMKIANTVPLLLVGAFVFIAPLTGMPLPDVAWHLLAGFLVLLVTFGFFAMGAMGGGDAKLLAATAVWIGYGIPTISYVALASILGGVLTLAILVFRKSPLHEIAGHNMFLRNFTEGAKGVPYGIALGAAGLIAFTDSPLFVWALARLAG